MAIKEATVLLLLLVLVLLFERSPQPLYDENITGVSRCPLTKAEAQASGCGTDDQQNFNCQKALLARSVSRASKRGSQLSESVDPSQVEKSNRNATGPGKPTKWVARDRLIESPWRGTPSLDADNSFLS
eukprot:742826-Rhodomonas_salina.1